MKYLIIGNSAAAIGAVEGIRRFDAISPITIIAEEPHHTYARPLISYLLSGKVSKEKMVYRPLDFYALNNVTPMLGMRVVSVDTQNKHVVLTDGTSLSFDKLLIATGSHATALQLPGTHFSNVFSFYTMADTEILHEQLKEGMRAVVIGAGLTALKAAEALVTRNVQTTLVVRSRILRTFLDQGAAELLLAHLKENGLHLVIGYEPQTITGSITAEAVILTNGESLPCDLVINAVGITTNIEVIVDTPIHVDKGILVNEFMQTTVSDVYAAGDVAQGFDTLTGERRVIPLLPVAYAQGETAGRNMAGDQSKYRAMGMNAVSFFGLPLISAGLLHGADGDDIHIKKDQASKTYRKLVFHNEHLRGFVLVNDVDRAGLLTWLIREKVDIRPFKESLLAGTFNYAHLPPALRKKRLAAADRAS